MSISTPSFACFQPRLTAARVFSGASYEAPRWAMISTPQPVPEPTRRIKSQKDLRAIDGGLPRDRLIHVASPTHAASAAIASRTNEFAGDIALFSLSPGRGWG